MELYSSILKLAPLVLLKLLLMGAFLPLNPGEGRFVRLAVAGTGALVFSVIAGGVVATLVLGDVIPPTPTARWIVIISGCLSLVLLAVHMLREIGSLYKARPHANALATASESAPDSQRPAK
jgi:hypothetical protein